jgi:hypothetical protein
MEVFQITNKQIFEVSDFLFSEYAYRKSDKICNLKLL